MDKKKLNTAMQVLHEVSVEYSDYKDFMEGHLEQRSLKENLSAEEVIYTADKHRSTELAQQKLFFCVASGFKTGTCAIAKIVFN